MKKRWLSILLILTLTITSLAACSGKENGTDGGDSASKELPDYTKEANEFGWVKPTETIEFSVYAGLGDQEELLADEAGGKALYDAWLLENLNVKINWQYYSMDMDEKLNLMLANGDYPDVITWMSDDMANKFIAQGKAIDLTDLIAKYGDNITRRMGDYFNFLKDDSGKVSKLAQSWGENPNVAGHDFGARYDYWLELGDEKVYSTLDEYYDVMARILENHPTNENGQKTYAFSAADKEGTTLLNALLGAYGFVNGYKVLEDGSFAHWLNTDEGLEIAQFMNKCYRNGMVDPDFLTNGYEEYITKLTNGQLLGNMNVWWYAWVGGHQAWAVQEGDAYDINKRFMNVSVAPEGKALEDTTLLTSKYTGSYRCIITDKCKNPEWVLAYLNWENSELGNFITGWGVPSEDNVWNYDADGNWIVDDAILDVDRKDETFHKVKEKNGAGIYMTATNCNWLKTDALSDFSKLDKRIDRVSVYDYWPVDENGEFSNEGVNIAWGNYKAPAKDITLFEANFPAEDPITITKQTLTDQFKVEWAKMITADSEEACIAAFNTAKENCNNLGLADLTAYYQKAYENNTKILEGN